MTPPLRIPTHWSPEQALAIQQFLHLLAEQLWQCYELDILDLIGPHEASSIAPLPPWRPPAQIDLFEHHTPCSDDHDLPF